MRRERPTLRPGSSQTLVLSVEDLVSRVLEAHDTGSIHFATIARESILEALRRGSPKPPPPPPSRPDGLWDEVTRDVGTRDTKRTRAVKRRT